MMMKGSLALACVVLLSSAARAADASSVLKWFENLKKGLIKNAVSAHYQKGRSLAAVAAVRGAEQKLDDPDQPYFKGAAGSKEAKAAREQRKELSAAVDLLLSGKTSDGIKRLEEFEAAHPDSPILAEAKEALQKAKELPSEAPAVRVIEPAKAEGAAEEPKPDAKGEPKPGEKAEPKPDAKAEPKPDAKAEPKPDAKAEPKPDEKAEPKPDAKTEPETKAEPKPDAKTAPETKTEPKPDDKAQPAKEQPKADPAKEPSKSEPAKEQPKADPAKD